MDWFQDGKNIKYQLSDYNKDINDLNIYKQKEYMQLKFEFTFGHENDEVMCCYTVPYSYSEL